MGWIKIIKTNNYDKDKLYEIVEFFIFNCPSCQKKKTKKQEYYNDVSKRKCSFRKRNIQKSLLITILSKIKKGLIKDLYRSFSHGEEINIESIIREASIADKYPNAIIFYKRSDMSDTEAIYYYIRNALAHGSFDIKKHNDITIYRFESSKDNKTKAQIQLKEDALFKLKELGSMNLKEVLKMRKKKKK